ncbi:hypothetical protein IFO70_25245 [Phormidium tenue FACHB-886]|nr:hypothetical protein [Phormidium tenue FACHB-886]
MPAEGQADYFATYAKALNVLGRYDEAEAMARQGLTFDSTHKRCKIQLADALHLKGETEAGYRLYNEILYQHISQPGLGQNNTLSFEQRVGFDGNVLHSPVYAINLLEHSPDAIEAAWQWAEDEFYWSPYFRCHHAYHLIDQGEGLRAFVKLLALIKEMPWVKEAALNTMTLFEQLDPGGQKQLAIADRQWLTELIAANRWRSEGMSSLGSKKFRLGSQTKLANTALPRFSKMGNLRVTLASTLHGFLHLPGSHRLQPIALTSLCYRERPLPNAPGLRANSLG